MTRKDYEQTKEWLERVTGMTFDGETSDGNDEAVFEENERWQEESCAVFSKDIPDSTTLMTLIFTDNDCKVEVSPLGQPPITLNQTSRSNAHLCVEVFDYAITHN